MTQVEGDFSPFGLLEEPERRPLPIGYGRQNHKEPDLGLAVEQRVASIPELCELRAYPRNGDLDVDAPFRDAVNARGFPDLVIDAASWSAIFVILVSVLGMAFWAIAKLT